MQKLGYSTTLFDIEKLICDVEVDDFIPTKSQKRSNVIKRIKENSKTGNRRIESDTGEIV